MEVRKPGRFASAFGLSGEEVLVRITKAGRGSTLELIQSKVKTTPQLRVSMYLGCQCGPMFCLSNLKAFWSTEWTRGDDSKAKLLRGLHE